MPLRTLATIGSIVLGVSLVSGCHQYVVQPPPPLRTVRIIEMTREGVAATDIIAEIERTGTVYRMDSQDVVDLREKGVDPRVIDHMMKTAERDAQRRAVRTRVYYGPGYYGPYWYGPSWYGPSWHWGAGYYRCW